MRRSFGSGTFATSILNASKPAVPSAEFEMLNLFGAASSLRLMDFKYFLLRTLNYEYMLQNTTPNRKINQRGGTKDLPLS